MPRPKIFKGVPPFQKSRVQYIIGTADSDNDPGHGEDLDYDPSSPDHDTFWYIYATQKFSNKILRQNVSVKKCHIGKIFIFFPNTGGASIGEGALIRINTVNDLCVPNCEQLLLHLIILVLYICQLKWFTSIYEYKQIRSNTLKEILWKQAYFYCRVLLAFYLLLYV